MEMVSCVVFLLVVCCILMQQTAAMYYDYDDSPESEVGYRGYGGTGGFNGYNSHQHGYRRDGSNDGYPGYSDNNRYGDNDDDDDDDDDDDKSPCALTRYKRQPGMPCAISSPCVIDWSQYKEKFHPPLLLNANTNDIILPEMNGGRKEVSVAPGTTMTVSCPGGDLEDSIGNTIMSGTGAVAGIYATCVATGSFVDSRMNPINSFGCSSKVKDWTEVTTNRCGNGVIVGDLVYIRFNTFGGGFYDQIEVCFDKAAMSTLWSRHILHGHNYPARIHKRGSGNWIGDGLFHDQNTIEAAYNTANQKALIYKKLNQNVIYPAGAGVRRPTGVPSGLFFAKGHLAPDNDFVTLAERDATYHYINAVPQWQADNSGNWLNIVEVSVQRLAEKLDTRLIIVSGGHGILKLKDNNNNDVPIYLIEAQGGNPDQVPAPELMWKVVYNPATNEAVAFAVTNNPYIGQLTISPAIPRSPCAVDVCGRLDSSWFKANDPSTAMFKANDRYNYHKGFTYCCGVADLMNTITTIPTGYQGGALLTG